MAKTKKHKNVIVLILLILVGIVLGSVLSTFAAKLAFLKWLAFGINYGLPTPFVLDLNIISITFGFTFKVTVGSIIGVIISIIIYGVI